LFDAYSDFVEDEDNDDRVRGFYDDGVDERPLMVVVMMIVVMTNLMMMIS